MVVVSNRVSYGPSEAYASETGMYMCTWLNIIRVAITCIAPSLLLSFAFSHSFEESNGESSSP